MNRDWTSKASCIGLEPMFDYEKRDVQNKELMRIVRNICGSCEVQQECLADALAFDEQYTIRGGLTPTERNQIKEGTT